MAGLVVLAGASAKHSTERAALYCGDALDLLPLIPSGTVDLILTSPPYNIGKSYEQVLPLDEYVDWVASWMQELYRICAPNGTCWLNLGYTAVPGRGIAVPLPYLLWDCAPFFLIQEIVWHYRAGVACRRRFSPRNEKLLWFVKDPGSHHFDLDAVRCDDVRYPNQKRNGRMRCNPLGRNPSDVWEIPKVTSGRNRSSRERQDHPAQMPLALAERIVLASSRPGDVVLDPFAGSGTTLAAAVSHGRAGIGIERRADYLEIAAVRLQSGVTV